MILAQFAAAGPLVGAQTTALAGLTDMYLFAGSGDPVLFTVTRGGGWLSAYDLGQQPGSATLTDSWYLSEEFLQLETTDLAVVYGQDGAELVLAGLLAADLQSVTLSDGARVFESQSNWQIQGQNASDFKDIVMFGGSSFGLVSLRSGGLLSIDVPASGVASALAVPASSALVGASVSAIITGELGGVSYGAAAYGDQDALSLFRLNGQGGTDPIAELYAGPDTAWFSDPAALGLAEVDGETYLIVAASGSGSLGVLAFDPDGSVQLVDHVLDTLDTRFAGASVLDVVVVESQTYVIAAGADSGLSVFTILPGGRLHHLDTIAGTAESPLDGITGLETLVTGQSARIWVSTQSAPYLAEYTLSFPNLGERLIASDQGGTVTGGAKDDVLTGAGGNDILSGGAGADILMDGAGQDSLTGGSGADEFVFVRDDTRDIITDFEPGVDRIDMTGLDLQWDLSELIVLSRGWGAELRYGDEIIEVHSLSGVPLGVADFSSDSFVSTDRVTYQGTPVEQVQIVYATSDTLVGTAFEDWLHGRDTADQIWGGAAEDTIWGVAGDDQLFGGSGNDYIEGGDGNDTILGEAGFDSVYGGQGNDILDGGDHADDIYGGTGNDRLLGGDGYDTLYGEDGDDTLLGGDTVDRLYGGNGNDLLRGGVNLGLTIEGLFGGAGDDRLYGDGGFDLLDGEDGNDFLDGGNQADNLYGRAGSDTLYGSGGFDRLFGGLDDDFLFGGAGTDGLFGEEGNDQLSGGEDSDRLWGGTGNDVLLAGPGDDELRGGAGFDQIDGGTGDDQMWGNFNADVFIFADGHGSDRIMDFDALNPNEKLDFTGVTAVSSFNDVQSASTQIGADLSIDTGNGNSILLTGVFLVDLDATDFLF